MVFTLGACGDSLGSVKVVGLLETLALSLTVFGKPNFSPLTIRYFIPMSPCSIPRMDALSTNLHVTVLFVLLAGNCMMVGESLLNNAEVCSVSISSLSKSCMPNEPMLTVEIYTIKTMLGAFNLRVS